MYIHTCLITYQPRVPVVCLFATNIITNTGYNPCCVLELSLYKHANKCYHFSTTMHAYFYLQKRAHMSYPYLRQCAHASLSHHTHVHICMLIQHKNTHTQITHLASHKGMANAKQPHAAVADVKENSQLARNKPDTPVMINKRAEVSEFVRLACEWLSAQ